MRGGAEAEWNFLELAGLRIETPGKPLLLATEPHAAVERRRHVVRKRSGGKLIEPHLRRRCGSSERKRYSGDENAAPDLPHSYFHFAYLRLSGLIRCFVVPRRKVPAFANALDCLAPTKIVSLIPDTVQRQQGQEPE